MHVALGLIYNHKNEILISQRPLHKYKGGYWEFPGGKIEREESSYAALQRELFEELNIIVSAADFLQSIEHHYSAYSVCLDVWRVRVFQGQALSREAQPLCWIHPQALKYFKLLEGNLQLMQKL